MSTSHFARSCIIVHTKLGKGGIHTVFSLLTVFRWQQTMPCHWQILSLSSSTLSSTFSTFRRHFSAIFMKNSLFFPSLVRKCVQQASMGTAFFPGYFEVRWTYRSSRNNYKTSQKKFFFAKKGLQWSKIAQNDRKKSNLLKFSQNNGIIQV